MTRIGAFCRKWSLRVVALCLGVVAMFMIVVVLATLGAALLVATAVPEPKREGSL